MSRTLETILTGTNRLSPVLREAARDVEQFRDTVEGSHRRAAESSDSAADRQVRSGSRIAEANRRIRESADDTARQVEASNQRQARSTVDAERLNAQANADASRQLAATRAQLVELGRNKIRADVDTTEARQQLYQLRQQLEALNRADPSPRVRAETDAATAQLRAVQAQLNRIDGQSVTATVNVRDNASSEMRTLTAVALGVSPALTSIGSVAMAGLGTIGPLAAAGAAGLGVLTLGVVGVADAVELIGKRQDQVALEAGKAAGAASISGASQAAAARQVESAQASLANTRANAADAAVRSAEQVSKAQRDVARAERDAARDIDAALDQQATAERDLSTAQRDQRQAQDDLTSARRTAQQQIEDLTGNVADNALSQRQSVLDVADARRELDKVMADPRSTTEQREQAQISYEQQVRRQESLEVQGRRLLDQQAESTARGVEGSSVVVAAQQRLADATQRVGDATQAVGDSAADVDRARVEGAQRVADAQGQVTSAIRDQASQSRQAAFSIAQAQAGVASALAATAAASAGSGAAVSDTLARIDQELAEVNPATLEFATYVKDRLEPAWKRLKDTAAAGLLPGVREGAENLMTYLPSLDGFVGRLSGRFGQLAVEGSQALTNPFWRNFFQMIESNADPILTTFVHTLGNTATGFAGIISAFMPMSRDVGEGIEELSQDFAQWGEELSSSEGFRQFTAYVQENWPKIRETVANVAQVVGNLVEAGLPIGSAYLTGFQLLSEVLAGLPVGVVQALLVAFLGFKAVSAVTDVIGKVSDAFGGLNTTTGETQGTIGRLQETLSDNTGLDGFRTAAREAAEGGAGRLGSAAAGVVGFMGGPWGIAMAGAGAAIGIVTASIEANKAKVEAWTAAIVAGGEAAADAERTARANSSGGFNSFLDSMQFGGQTSPLEQMLGSDDDELWDQAEQSAGDLWRAMAPLQQAQQKVAEWTETLNRRQNDQSVSARDTAIAYERLQHWTGEVARQQSDLDVATTGATDAMEAQQRTLDDLTSSYRSTAGTQAAFYEAVARADGALVGMSGNVLNAAGDLDTQSEAGRRTQDVLFGIADAANRHIDAMTAQGETFDVVQGKDAELRQSFYDTAYQMTGSREAAERLTNQIYGIPAERTTTITADTSQATTAAAELQRAINNLQGRRLTVQLDTMEVGNGVYQRAYETANGGRAVGVAFAATGGPIHGPGGPTDDKAGLWALSNGEHVWTAAEVAAAGGHSAVEELRQEVLSNGRGRAAGGPIEMSLALDQQQALIDMGGYAGKFIGGLVAMGSRVPTAGPAGPMGGGSVDGGWRGLFADVKAAIPQARINSTYRPGDPGYHGRDMAVDFGFGSGPGGAGSAGLASINRLIHDRYGANMLELIYDGVGDDRPDLKNMRPHTYNQATQREHRNHVHAVPREHGGPVDPSTLYEVGERGREFVRFDRPGEVYPADQATRLLTPAASPGYGPAGTGGALGAANAADIAREFWAQAPQGFGLSSLVNIGSYQEVPEGPRDLARELVYQARAQGW